MNNGNTISDVGIDPRERALIELVVATARGDLEAIRDLVHERLGHGWTLTEIGEIVLHCAVYLGWPLAGQLDSIVSGEVRLLGLTGGPYEDGWMPVDTSAGRASASQVFEAAMLKKPSVSNRPYVTVGTLGFVFGELWQRPGLTVGDRRIISIVSCLIGNAPGPAAVHVYSALATGDLPQAKIRAVGEFALRGVDPAQREAMRAIVSKQLARAASQPVPPRGELPNRVDGLAPSR